MSSEQEFDDGFHEDMTSEEGVAEESMPDDQAADADFTDGDWDDSSDADTDSYAEDGEMGEDGEQPSDRKLSKKKMNLLILGGAAVIGLGIFYWQTHKTVSVPLPTKVAIPAAAPTETDMIYGKEDQQQAGDNGKNNKEKTKFSSGFLNDPKKIIQAQRLSDNHQPTDQELTPDAPHTTSQFDGEKQKKPPQPAPIKQTTDNQDEDEDQPLTPMPQDVAGNMVKPGHTAAPGSTQTWDNVANPHANTTITKPADTHVRAPMTSTASATNPSELPAQPHENHAMTPATTPAATPSNAEANPLTGQSNPVNPMPATAQQQNAGVSSAQFDNITSKLAGIESQLQALQGSVVQRGELADLKARLSALEQRVNTMPSSGVRTTAPAVKHSSSAPAHHHSATTRKTAPAKTPSATASREVWTLKSAMPGMALIAGKTGQIITVRTGDHIAGLGRIKSIGETNGHWIVRGTSGSLNQ